jgi:hypothetical protein
MTPRDIRAHLEASQGRMCARLTFESGRLQVLQPEVEPTPAAPARRVSPVAATLFGMWLGAGVAHAQPQPPTAPPTHAEGAQVEGRVFEIDRHRPRVQKPVEGTGTLLEGRIIDPDGQPLPGAHIVLRHASSGQERTVTTQADGLFTFRNLPAGLHDLSGTLGGFEIEPRENLLLEPGQNHQADLTGDPSLFHLSTFGGLGGLGVTQEPIHRQFANSELVVEAVVGASEILEAKPDLVERRTELRIEKVFKGETSKRYLAYRHSVYPEALDDDEDNPFRPLTPGTRVLAFLGPSPDSVSETALEMVSSDFFGPLRLDDEELEAYTDRLEDLAGLHHHADDDPIDPADWMEWLVATAENPHTRNETVEEIVQALDALFKIVENSGAEEEAVIRGIRLDLDAWRAGGQGKGEPLRSAFLGASLTENQKRRLAKALQKTERFEDADCNLFRVVYAWDPDTAATWLEHQLRNNSLGSDEEDSIFWLVILAEHLGSERAKALAEVTEEKMNEMYEQRNLSEEPEAEQQFWEAVGQLRQAVQQQFLEILARRR